MKHELLAHVLVQPWTEGGMMTHIRATVAGDKQVAVGAVDREEHPVKRAPMGAVGAAHRVVFHNHALARHGDDADAAEAAVENRHLFALAIEPGKITGEPATADPHIVGENGSAVCIATANLDADAEVVKLAILDDDE